MVVEDRVVSAILSEQFRRFTENNVLEFAHSDEELNEAARHIGVQSLADLRFAVTLHVFMRNIEQSAKYN